MLKGLLPLTLAAFIVITAYQAWDHYVRVDQPETLLLTEDALATEALLALGSVNVAHAVRLESAFLGAPDTQAAGQRGLLDGSAFARFKTAGIDPRDDLSQLVFAVYQGDSAKPAYALALLGRFDQQSLLSSLKDDYEVSAQKAGGWPVYQLREQDVDTCEWSDALSLYVSRGLILVTRPAHMPSLLDRLKQRAPAQRRLTRWREFRASQLGSLALFVPDESPDTGNPLLQQPVDKAHDTLGVFTEVYFGLGFWPVPVRGRFDLMLAGDDSQAASRLAGVFQKAVDGSKRDWSEQMPTVARLYDALAVEAQDGTLRLSASVDREWFDTLAEIPREIINLISRRTGLRLKSASGAAPEERIDENPVHFAPAIDADSLPAYEAEPPFLAEADAVSGPFGIRLSAVELGDRPDERLQLTVSGVHRGIPNLGRAKERVQLRLEHVTDADGNELLREESCGRERNSVPANLDDPHFKGSFKGEKTVRLRAGVHHADVASIAGRVDLLLPVQTETLKLDSIAEEITVDRDDFRVALQRTGDDTLSYKVYGDARRLLAVRGLNAAGQPLSHAGSMSGGFLFGEGRSVSQSFAGKVVSAELVLATQDVKKSFPFVLENLRPKPTATESRHEPVTVEPYSLTQLERDFSSTPLLPDGSGEVLAQAPAGPFRLALTRLDQSLFGLSTAFTLVAPPVPGLTDNLSAVVLEVSSVENAVGDNLVTGAPHYEAVRLQRDWQDDSLLQARAAVRFEDRPEESVARIKGKVRLSLPRRLDSVSIDAAEVGTRVNAAGESVTLRRLDDKGFSLDFGVRRPAVVAVNAYNASGESIWVPHPALSRVDERWVGVFPTHGGVARIELMLAGELEEAQFPFEFSLPQGDRQALLTSEELDDR